MNSVEICMEKKIRPSEQAELCSEVSEQYFLCDVIAQHNSVS